MVNLYGVLADSPDAGVYRRRMKQRLGAEGSEVVTFCHGLELEAHDSKALEDANVTPPTAQ